MVAGAPRTVTPSEDEVEVLGKEYIQWLEENPEAIHHTEWYSIYKKMLKTQWEALRQTKQFLPYHEQGRAILASRMRKAQVVKEGIAHRYLSLLDTELKEHDKELVEHKANAGLALEQQKTATLVEIAKAAAQGNIKQD